MRAPITVNYTPNGDDWTVTVNVAGEQSARTATADGLVAARDRADQLVAQLAPGTGRPPVVHLLDGDAYAFTNSYLQARLGLPQKGDPESTNRVDDSDETPTPSWPETNVADAESPDDVQNRG